MNDDKSVNSCDDVLDAFLMEIDMGRTAIERYLRQYPQYAVELLDVSRGVSEVNEGAAASLSVGDQDLIQAAWDRHVAVAPAAATDPLAALEPAQLNLISRNLSIPRQVLTAFRERRVVVDSIPQRFLQSLASEVNSSVDWLREFLRRQPGALQTSRHKSSVKPTAPAKVSFEQLLIDAEVEADRISELMSGEQ